ncbi:MAG: Ig-like domain-containing protein [Mogibacterium sp.]|nr:Ig-like domain-containing protein [Mogibacterium sp.]
MNRRILSRILSILMITALILPAASMPMEVSASSRGLTTQTAKAKKKAKYKLYFSNIDSNTVIKKGKKLKVQYYASNGKRVKVKFKSSNKKIATISKNGTIKAKKNGTVKITVYAKSNKKIKRTVKIRVGKPVTELKIKGVRYMRPGRSSDLDVSTTPSNATVKSVYWASSDPSIATVNSSGKVSAKRQGVVTITATAKDGSGTTRSEYVYVHKFLRTDTKWVAHRGLHESAIENSPRAFELAGQAGFWGVECDVWETGHEAVQRQTIPVKPEEPEEPTEPTEPTETEQQAQPEQSQSAQQVAEPAESATQNDAELAGTAEETVAEPAEQASGEDAAASEEQAAEPTEQSDAAQAETEQAEQPAAETATLSEGTGAAAPAETSYPAMAGEGDGSGNTGNGSNDSGSEEPVKTDAVLALEAAIKELPARTSQNYEYDLIDNADEEGGVNKVQAMYDALTEDETYTVDTDLLRDLFDAKYIVDEYNSFDIIINHDKTLNRLYGVSIPVRTLTPSTIRLLPGVWDGEQNRICFLDRYLGICKQYNMVPVIELKDPDMSPKATKKMVDKVYKTLGSVSQDKVHFISFYEGQLTQVRNYTLSKYKIEPYTAYLVNGTGIDGKLQLAKALGFTGVDITRTFLTEEVMSKCLSLGLKVDAWTYEDSLADDERLYKHFISGQFRVESATVDGKLFS